MLTDLAIALGTRDQGEEADGVFAEANRAAERIREDRPRAAGQRVVASGLARAGRHEEATSAACAIKDDFQRASAMLELARALTKAGAVDEASPAFSDAARAIENLEGDPRKAEVSNALVRALVEAGRYAEATRAIREGTHTRAYARPLAARARPQRLLGATMRQARLWRTWCPSAKTTRSQPR
jgi:hypothetical protein